jgi:hypothetical protein
LTFNGLHGVVSQKIEFFIRTEIIVPAAIHVSEARFLSLQKQKNKHNVEEQSTEECI